MIRDAYYESIMDGLATDRSKLAKVVILQRALRSWLQRDTMPQIKDRENEFLTLQNLAGEEEEGR